YTSVMEAPRLNPNIDHSPRDVKLSFMDNLYMDIMPTAPDGPNGSGKITDFPEMSKALKQCAKLRRHFLSYFLDGKLIGECILNEPCEGAHVTAYVLPDRALVMAMNCDWKKGTRMQAGAVGDTKAKIFDERKENLTEQRSFNLHCDLTHWVRSTSGSF